MSATLSRCSDHPKEALISNVLCFNRLRKKAVSTGLREVQSLFSAQIWSPCPISRVDFWFGGMTSVSFMLHSPLSLEWITPLYSRIGPLPIYKTFKQARGILRPLLSTKFTSYSLSLQPSFALTSTQRDLECFWQQLFSVQRCSQTRATFSIHKISKALESLKRHEAWSTRFRFHYGNCGGGVWKRNL